MDTSFLISIVVVELISLALLLDIWKLKIKVVYRIGLSVFILVPLIGLGFYLLLRPNLGFTFTEEFSHRYPRGDYMPKMDMGLKLKALNAKIAQDKHKSNSQKIGKRDENNDKKS